MNSDDIELLAYVDGSLSTLEHEAVERKLAESPDAALRVRWLAASRLPYAQAFAQQRLPAVPPSLERMVGGIARAARLDASAASSAAGIERRAGANDADAHNSASHPRKGLRETVVSNWIAATIIAGVLVCGIAQYFDLNDAHPGVASNTHNADAADAAAPWVEAAAHYQRLYSRDTLANVEADRALSKETVSQIRRNDDLAVSIPDLSAYGLTFKRVQRLRFDGRLLVQIVYLPDAGDPVALCVMRETQPDATIADHVIASMTVVTWRRSEAGYALIGASDSAGLKALARHIADGDTTPLFGANGAPDEMRAMLAYAQ
ncbi:anti-sigma factor [Caballeronia novacaledonica]|uniref:Anti-sigma factor n=1 Tax=Caballeronia novacaledonica TaxID=1544861 RepID=A0A2U3I126_9BURK|nr:anti-sigma factor [Caballeronia novacaledonica]SPB13800.1 anti-sigma factor [Caballeronia novacaledonica]